jgi:hypothetical protein
MECDQLSYLRLTLVLTSTFILGSESSRNHDYILLAHDSGSRAAPQDVEVL